MLGARRYVRLAGALPEFLRLYAMCDTDVLQSAPYRRLLDHPTEWSIKMRLAFRGFKRLCCRRIASFGGGAAGVLCAIPVDDRVDLRPAELHRALLGLLSHRPFVAVHAIERDRAVADVPFRIGGDAPDFPDHGAILIEGYDEAMVAEGIADTVTALGAVHVDAGATLTTYRLAYAPRRRIAAARGDDRSLSARRRAASDRSSLTPASARRCSACAPPRRSVRSAARC